MRSISRTVGVSINTVSKLLVNAGEACAEFHNDTVQKVKSRRVQCNEIWSFCYAKQKNVKTAKAALDEGGDIWTWTALDADSKLIVSYLVGERDAYSAHQFVEDVSSRLTNRVQLTIDGHKAYLDAVEDNFGHSVDYAQLVKIYGEAPKPEHMRYSPAHCEGTVTNVISSDPDSRYISTSHVERHNSTMRMNMRRFTRLSNAFSKKIENHIHMLSLYFVHYNFCRINKSIRVTPVMEAELTDTLYDIDFIIDLIDAREPKSNKRGPYKKRISN